MKKKPKGLALFVIITLIGIVSMLSMTGQLSLQTSTRFPSGPYRIQEVTASGWEATSTSMWIRLRDDPKYLGGIEENNTISGFRETLRRFKVTCPDSGLAFDDVQFSKRLIDGDSLWVGTIDSLNISRGSIGSSNPGEFDLSTLSIGSCYCEKSWDALPIWWGKWGVVAFTTDDGLSENWSVYETVLDTMPNVEMTAFVDAIQIGETGFVTLANLQSMVQNGWEVGGHLVSAGTGPRNHRGQLTDYRSVSGGPHFFDGRNFSIMLPNDCTSCPIDDYAQYGSSFQNVHQSSELANGVDTLSFNQEAGTYDRDNYQFLMSGTDTVDLVIDSVGVYSWAKSDSGTATYYNFYYDGTLRGGSQVNLTNAFAEYGDIWTSDQGNPWYWNRIITGDYTFGPAIRGTNDKTVSVAAVWLKIWWTSTRGNAYGTNPDTLLGAQLNDMKRELEEMLIPVDPNFRARGYAFPRILTDGRIRALGSTTYDYMRSGVRADRAVTGVRNSDPTYSSWSQLRPWEISRLLSETTIFGPTFNYTPTQVDSAMTARLQQLEAYTAISKNGGTVERENLILALAFHDEVSAAQLEAAINAVLNEGSWTIRKLGDVVDYWRRSDIKRRYQKDPG